MAAEDYFDFEDFYNEHLLDDYKATLAERKNMAGKKPIGRLVAVHKDSKKKYTIGTIWPSGVDWGAGLTLNTEDNSEYKQTAAAKVLAKADKFFLNVNLSGENTFNLVEEDESPSADDSDQDEDF